MMRRFTCAKSNYGIGSFQRRSSLSVMPNRLATYSGERMVNRPRPNRLECEGFK